MVDNTATPKVEKKHPFLSGDVVLDLSNGLTDTLNVIAGVQSSFDIPYVQNNWTAENDLTVSINIQSEPHVAQIRFHFSKELLGEIVKKIFNETTDPNNAEITDCLGEISNICSGYAKTKLNEKGFALKTALPSSVSKTEDLPKTDSAHPNIVIPFTVLNKLCQMQVIILK